MITHNERELVGKIVASIYQHTYLHELKRDEDNIEKINMAVHIALKERGIFKSCLTCDHFNRTNDTCKIKQNKRPPARIIVKGCKQFSDDIPF